MLNQNKIAIALLCREPHKNHMEFFNQMENYDVFFICDMNNAPTHYPEYPHIQFIQIPDEEARTNGFRHCNINVIAKDVISWDKVLYYFCRVNHKYDHVWLIEDDVFVPDLNTLPMIDQKYETDDLLCRSNGANTVGTDFDGWTWRYGAGKHELPWYCSMVCAIRVSKKLLTKIDDYVLNRGELFFLEMMFNTIAMANGLKVNTIPELLYVEFKCGDLWYQGFQAKEIFDTHLYHPMKNIDKHDVLREEVKQNRIIRRK